MFSVFVWGQVLPSKLKLIFCKGNTYNCQYCSHRICYYNKHIFWINASRKKLFTSLNINYNNQQCYFDQKPLKPCKKRRHYFLLIEKTLLHFDVSFCPISLRLYQKDTQYMPNVWDWQFNSNVNHSYRFLDSLSLLILLFIYLWFLEKNTYKEEM